MKIRIWQRLQRQGGTQDDPARVNVRFQSHGSSLLYLFEGLFFSAKRAVFELGISVQKMLLRIVHFEQSFLESKTKCSLQTDIAIKSCESCIPVLNGGDHGYYRRVGERKSAIAGVASEDRIRSER